MSKLTLKIIEDTLTIYRLPPDSEIPAQLYESDFYTVSKTDDEISIVCDASIQLHCETSSTHWRGYKVAGPLDFSLTGILAEIATVLADAGISIFAISTYDTDYILVKEDKMKSAHQALQTAGYSIV